MAVSLGPSAVRFLDSLSPEDLKDAFACIEGIESGRISHTEAFAMFPAVGTVFHCANYWAVCYSYRNDTDIRIWNMGFKSEQPHLRRSA